MGGVACRRKIAHSADLLLVIVVAAIGCLALQAPGYYPSLRLAAPFIFARTPNTQIDTSSVLETCIQACTLPLLHIAPRLVSAGSLSARSGWTACVACKVGANGRHDVGHARAAPQMSDLSAQRAEVQALAVPPAYSSHVTSHGRGSTLAPWWGSLLGSPTRSQPCAV